MNNTAIIKRAEAETHRLLKQAMEMYRHPVPEIELRFDLTGRSAGMFRFPAAGHPIIRYNKVLLTENPDDFLARTVPHEVAHLVVRNVFGADIQPHGAEWKSVMAFFGAEATRCHNYDVSRSSTRRLRRFTYYCSCREHQLSTIRHNRIKAGQSYQCVCCNQSLKRNKRESA